MIQPDVGHILVIDDNESNRMLLSSRLQRQGHTVQMACNGVEALEIVRAEPFDILLLDIMMPDMDGYHVLEAVKADAKLRHLPVIIISAIDDLDSVVRCIKLGADDYLLKPFNPVLLHARIRSSLERKRLHDREQAHATAVQVANQAKSEFISFIAHELKTPLTIVRGFIDVLALGMVGEISPAQAQYMTTMRVNVDLMVKLVSDLADIERIESGQITLQWRSIYLPGIITSVVQSLGNQFAEKEQTVSLDIPDNLPLVWADQVRVTQVVTNLVTNASKYTPQGGQLSLLMEVADNCWDPARGGEVIHVVVRDTGIGISEKDQQRIFEKYFRTSNERAMAIPGMGLGLNISRRLIQLQGGQIWCESVLGEGTAFHFTLPVAPNQTAIADQ